jgi:AraC family transcriptional regulator
MMDSVKPPHLERFGPLVLAGLCRSHRLPSDPEDLFRDISGQWRDFSVLRGALQPVANVDFGIGLQMTDGGETLDYCCGVPVLPDAELPAGLAKVRLPAMHCAVFQHTDHVSRLRETMELIFGTMLPMAELEPADEASGVPEFIERYSKEFNPDTGLGGLEVLIPLKD